MNGRDYPAFRFRVENNSGTDVQSFESIPIYDQDNRLIGAFSLDDYGWLNGFVSAYEHPLALTVATNEPFWITPVESSRGVSHAIISEGKLGVRSLLTKAAPFSE